MLITKPITTPYVVCHMMTSLNGKIDGDFMGAPECALALKEYGRLRKFFQCQATLFGTKTMASSYAQGILNDIPKSQITYPKEDFVAISDAENYIVSLDPQGTLAFKSNFIEKKNRPKSHVIEVLTSAVSSDYLAYLRQLNISYIFAGKKQFNCSLILQKLSTLFGITRVMLAGGGQTNWSFVHDNLVDELSIIIAPVADGGTKTSIFEKSTFMTDEKVASFHLKEAVPLSGDSLWLRYTI